MQDYYQILNVSPDASQEAIRKAFRKTAKAFHPDLFPGDSPNESKKRQIRFLQLTQAYEILSDKERRINYDFQRTRLSNKTPGSKNQSRRAKPNSSSQNKHTQTKKHEPYKESFQEPDEAIHELLNDVENLLRQFGLNVQDPLDMLLTWAKKIFRENFDDKTNLNDKKKESSLGTHQTQNHSSPETSTNMWEELEEELERIKKSTTNKPNIKKDNGHRTDENLRKFNIEIENELKYLKKKYQ